MRLVAAAVASTARALLIVLLVTLGAWWLLPSERLRGERAPAAAPTAEAAADNARLAADAGGAPAPERTELADGVPTLRLRVRSAAGQPVPARVFAGRAKTDPAVLQSDESRRVAPDVEAWLARFGQSVTADADGRAAFALAELPAQRFLHLCARFDDEFAEVYIAADQAPLREHEVALAPDREFAVVLRDAHGAPVPGVGVVAQWLEHDAMFDSEGLRRRTLGVTDAQGGVRALHVQSWREHVKPQDGSGNVTIGADLPGLEGQGVGLDLERLPTEPVQVVLPPLGAIAVEVIGHRPGDHLTPETSVVLQVVAPPESGRPPAYQAALDAEGRVRWPQVALDRRWRVSLRPVPREQELAGPTRAGETTTASFVRPVPLAVTGRLWHASQPLSNHQFSYSLTTASRLEGSLATTDGEGRFRLVVRAAAPGQSLLLRVECSAGEAVACSAASAQSLTYAAPATDVGDLHLTPTPLLVAGRLVGDADRKQTQVWIRSGAGPDEPGPRMALDASGAFACYGLAPRGPLALLVHSPAHEPIAAVPFVPGARDLEITLRAGATLHADFVVGENIAYITLAPRLIPSDGRERGVLLAGTADSSSLDQEGIDRACPDPRAPETLSHEPVTFRYRWQGLPAGRYRLAMLGYGQDTELHSAEVELAAGAHRAMPAVDLRARVRHVRVRLRHVDFDAPSQFGSHGYLFPLRGDAPQSPGTAFDNALVFLAQRDPLDVQIDVKGYRRQVLRGIADHVDVTLQPGIPVRIAAQSSAGAGELLFYFAPTTPPTAAFSPAAGGVTLTDMTMPVARDGEGFLARACAPGPHQLTAYLRDPSGYVHPCAVEPAEFAVPEPGLELAVRVRRR